MAFHPYPQLIRAVFNLQRFGPPLGFTPASAWPWIDRFGFGSTPTDSFALFRLAFAPAPVLNTLASPARSNSPDHNAKGTQSPRPHPKVQPKAPTACKRTVSGSLSLASRRSFHLSLTVLVHYRSQPVFSLGGWSPQIQSGFLGPRLTRVARPSPYQRFAYRTLTSCRGPFQAASAPNDMSGGIPPPWPHNPTPQATWFGLAPVRSPLLGGSQLDFSSSRY